MELFNIISSDEREAINYTISHYTEGGLDAPLDTILAPWSKAKQRLFDIFGGKLILEKEVEYNDSREIECNMDLLTSADGPYQLRQTLKRKFLAAIGTDDSYYGGLIDACFSYIALSDNYYYLPYPFHSKVEVAISDSKKVQFIDGAKPMRLLNKLAELLDEEERAELENFRIRVSQITNQRTLKGTLCLSIHPLDYMTMSDNASGWSSCMSWIEGGCYRSGTVEMMNSPMVVVGYLKSNNSPFTIGNFEWNNKKWRSLFIVDKEIICSVKDYPYHNSHLLGVCLDWLRELCGTENYLPTKHKFENDQFGKFYFTTECMYNDFGTTEHYCYVANEDCLATSPRKYLCYSGAHECMTCGCTNIDDFPDGEALDMGLSCCDCSGTYIRCHHCDDIISEDEIYWVCGNPVCPDCIDDFYVCDENTGNYVPNDKALTLCIPHYTIEEFDWYSSHKSIERQYQCGIVNISHKNPNIEWNNKDSFTFAGYTFVYNEATKQYTMSSDVIVPSKDFRCMFPYYHHHHF